jgi:thiamine pyrophosphate-dependent acetolactate synthase large subunit-like protein
VPAVPSASSEQVRQAAAWLVAAENPVILPGRFAPTQQAWDDFQALAEALGAAVLLDRQTAAAFPTNHYLCQAGLGNATTRESGDVLRAADVVLALQRTDPAGTLRVALTPPADTERGTSTPLAWPRLINVSLEPLLLSSWVADYQELPRAALPILTRPEPFVPLLLEEVRRALQDDPAAQRRIEARSERLRARRAQLEAGWEEARQRAWDQQPVSLTRVVLELRAALGERYSDAIVAAYLPQSWPSGGWDFAKPGGYLGGDGGAGLGASPSLTVGAALATAGSGRPTIGVVGDGATLMAPSALWTAAHHRIPALLIVANNQSYFNDEEHQDRVARYRGRPPENRWVGQRIAEPDVDFAMLARSLGVEGFGPIADRSQVRPALDGAVTALAEGRPALVEVRTAPR